MKSKSFVLIALAAMFCFAAGLAQAAEIAAPGTMVTPSQNFNYAAATAGTKVLINSTGINGATLAGSGTAAIDAGNSYVRWRTADGTVSAEFPVKIRFEDMESVTGAGYDMATVNNLLVSTNSKGKGQTVEGLAGGNGLAPTVILGFSIAPPSDAMRLEMNIVPDAGADYYSFVSAEGVDAVDDSALSITDAKVSSAGTSLWVTFSKDVFDFTNSYQVNDSYLTSAVNDNNINIVKMTSGAFKVDGTAATGLSAPALLTDDTTFVGNKTNLVRFTVAGTSNVVGGGTLTFNAGNTVSDLAGNTGNSADTGTVIATLADPSAMLAELRRTDWPGRAAGTNLAVDDFDVWVFFSNELNTGIVLPVNRFLLTDSAGAEMDLDADGTADFTVKAILGYQTDTDDVVRGVRVQVGSNDNVANGTDLPAKGMTTDAKTFANGATLYVAARGGADATVNITDIFGGTLTTTTGAANVAEVTDKTVPEISFVSSSDVDGDGRPDSIKFGTSETVTGTSSAGLHLETVGNTLDSGLIVVGGTTIDITSIGFLSIDAVFDPAAVDWDGDGNAGTADTDGEATPGGGDGDGATAWGKGVYTAATGNVIDASAASNALADFDMQMTKDGVGPVLDSVVFKTGDNSAFDGVDSYDDAFAEGDNAPGDQTENDIYEFSFSESVAASIANFNPTFVFDNGVPLAPRLGRAANTIVASGSVVQIVAGTADGSGTYSVGSQIKLLAGSGIADNAENAAVAATKTTTQGTKPYVLQHRSISGATVLGAYALDTDLDGFYEQLQLNFNAQIDTATDSPVASNFEIRDFAGSVTGVTVGSPWLILSITDDLLKHLPVNLVYTSNATENQEISDGTNEAVDTGTVGIAVNSVEQPLINTGQVYTMDVNGLVTDCEADRKVDGQVVGCVAGDKGKTAAMGSKIKFYGTRLIPTSVTIRRSNITAKLSGSAISALSEYFLGNTPYLYFSTQGACHSTGNLVTCDWTFLSSPSPNQIEGCCDADLVQVSITSDGSRCTGSGIQSCAITRNWAPAKPPYINCAFPGQPADCSASTALVDNNGTYVAHVSDKRAYIGNPVIGIFERPTGEQFMFANAVAGTNFSTSASGAITFGPEAFANKSNGDLGPGQSSPAPPINYPVNITNMQYQVIYPGWNPWPMTQTSGYYSGTTSNIPTRAMVSGTAVGNVYGLSSSFNMNQTFAGFADSTKTGTMFIDAGRWFADPQTLSSGILTIDNKGVKLDSGVNTLVPPYAAYVYVRGYDPTDAGAATFQASAQIDRLFVTQYGDEFDSTNTATLAIDSNNNNLGWYAHSNWRDDNNMAVTATIDSGMSLIGMDYIINVDRGGPTELNASSRWTGCVAGTDCDLYVWPVDAAGIVHYGADTNYPSGTK